MTHEYDINVESEEFKKRCTDIRALLTPKKISEIILENCVEVAKAIDDVQKRCVIIRYTSTASLLRRVRGGAEKVFNITSVTLEKARAAVPDSESLNNCDGLREFCCIIATARPVMPNEPINSGPMTIHTLSCMNTTIFDVNCALHGADSNQQTTRAV